MIAPFAFQRTYVTMTGEANSVGPEGQGRAVFFYGLQ